MIRPRPPEAPQGVPPVDPRRLVSSARDIWDAGYLAGYRDGVSLEQLRGGYEAGRAAGWQARVEHEHSTWQRMARFVREAGSPRAMTFERLHRLRHPDWVARPVPTVEQCMATWTDEVAA